MTLREFIAALNKASEDLDKKNMDAMDMQVCESGYHTQISKVSLNITTDDYYNDGGPDYYFISLELD